MYHQNHHHHHLHLPCLHCHPQSYIRMVQYMIERCLLLHMNRQQCVEALAKYASIRPCITVTVWKELQKENRGFFEAYFHAISQYKRFMGYYIQRKHGFQRKKRFWK
ncbi:hypothetical protein ERO13_A04G136000v2 [Gossypium hirsutum]|uniref:Uncharacterized protein n=1 Tax=Gossypium hirsutum TaxID=3635 RepID=A0A1U8M2J1_GOSHI|nr:uncharacterized protein LOC107933354 [Gossypium hirsutum]KAG4205986.1 hypothetical protein ERO13_A04G136000v2 [Gossypium hirsutum]